MERPYYPTDVSANLARDWPDARGFWLADDHRLAVYVNGKDHLQICSMEKTGDFKENFKTFSEFIKRVNNYLNI